jgi:hypothetical protein
MAKKNVVAAAKPATSTKTVSKESTVNPTPATPATPAIDPSLLEAFKAQMLALDPAQRKELLKGIVPSTRAAKAEPEIPEGFTAEQAKEQYLAAAEAARASEKISREKRNAARWALKVWMKLDPTLIIKRGRVITASGEELDAGSEE